MTGLSILASLLKQTVEIAAELLNLVRTDKIKILLSFQSNEIPTEFILSYYSYFINNSRSYCPGYFVPSGYSFPEL